MSDKPYFHEPDHTMVFWSLGHMLKGAGYAAAFVVMVGVVVWGIALLGQLLPDESRQTPSPYGALEVPSLTEGHDLA